MKKEKEKKMNAGGCNGIMGVCCNEKGTELGLKTTGALGWVRPVRFLERTSLIEKKTVH